MTIGVGCYEEALASAQQLVQVKDKAYLAWYELALAHKALGHDEEALQALERALRAGGNVLPAIPQSKGDWLYQLGRYEEARAAYEFGLRGSPRVRALWAGKTKALRALKRDQEAEAAEQELQRLEQRRAE